MEERDEYERKQQVEKPAELLQQNAAHINAMSYDHTTSGPHATHKCSRARARELSLCLSVSQTNSLAGAPSLNLSLSRARSLNTLSY
jgi:hypothetical protein